MFLNKTGSICSLCSAIICTEFSKGNRHYRHVSNIVMIAMKQNLTLTKFLVTAQNRQECEDHDDLRP